jgi:endonuclease/exonuclease/phosphatase family metal-dependent hydrolase
MFKIFTLAFLFFTHITQASAATSDKTILEEILAVAHPVVQSFAAPSAAPSIVDLRISTFNVLAPCYATPIYYPDNCAQVIANTNYRLSKIATEISVLKAAGTTVFCFQEITPEMYDGISATFTAIAGSGKFQKYVAYHDPKYWRTYQPDPLNPVPNGNATFVLTDFWNILALDNVSTNPTGQGAGNHAAYARLSSKTSPSHVFNVINVHLDSDHGGNRKKEIAGALNYLNANSQAGEAQLVVGDLNNITSSGSIKQILDSAGMVNSKNPLEATHPFSNGYNSNNNWASIDHILFKFGTATALGDTTIRNHGLWDTYPILSPDTNNPPRILANFDICGSDHFSVHGTIRHTT